MTMILTGRPFRALTASMAASIIWISLLVKAASVEIDSGNDCATRVVHSFNPDREKSTYRVGVHAIRGDAAAYMEYNKTFSDYLTATAGKRFDPPITFEMVPIDFQGLFDAVEEKELDFFYANPSMFSCVGTEVGAQPLATIVSRLNVRGRIFDLDVFAGVIFTKAGNDQINFITDLKDKIIGAGSMAQIMGGPLQFYEMEKAGMSYIMSPKQVVFTGNQLDVVNGVLSGDFDVGFVRTDTIERYVDQDGNAVGPDVFKVVSPRIYIMDDGTLFPFLHSTDVYPEWPLASLTHVNIDVQEEVQRALLEVGNHANLGHALAACEEENSTSRKCDVRELPEYLNVSLDGRCDVTEDLARLANIASDVGMWAGFRSPRSYFEARTMQEAAGFIVKDEKGNWKCTRSENFHDGIICPAGTHKKTSAEFDRSCENVVGAIPCKDTYECYCKPCDMSYEVAVFEDEEGVQGANISHYLTVSQGCSKMSVCGTVQQTRLITFHIRDNLQRDEAEVRVVMHDQDETIDLAVSRINGTWTYEFTWTSSRIGVGVMEVFFDGKQIPESPLRVEVVPRDCEIDPEGQGRVPDENGQCICGEGTIELAGECFSSGLFFSIIAAVLLVILLEAAFCFIGYKKRQSDQLWLINPEELHFGQPVEIIGQGGFGVVLKAEYRGTAVAIKRAMTVGKKINQATRRNSNDDDAGSKATLDSTGSKGVAQNDSTASLQASLDLEAQTHTCEKGASGGTHNSSGESDSQDGASRQHSGPSQEEDVASLNLDFLGGGFSFGHARSRRARWFPWLFKGEHSPLKSSIFATTASTSSRASAVATICPCLDKQTRLKNEFIQEMRLLSRLRHPCITTVMGAVIGSGHDPMLVMEFCEYGSLYDLLRNETLYTGGDTILQIVRDIAQGVRYLHSSKPPIFHGDLKAKNILIDSRFRAKVGDFGLSSKKNLGLTGTPYWLAPEYLKGKTEFNGSCDIYAIGIIIYEIYSRKVPYEGENPRRVLRKVCDSRVNRRPALPDCCPPRMVEIAKKCWSPDPFFRPQAKDLDSTFMDMNMQEAEPLSKESIRKAQPTGDMLYQVFPKHIADALKAGDKVEPESHENVTVFFSDVVHFTDISSSISPMKVSRMLDRLYVAFDDLARKHKVFKVETIGDAWMGVANLDGSQNNSHAKAIAEFALDAVEAAGNILIDEDDPERGYLRIRAGFHSGPVVSNVIGTMNPRYCLFGDTVNVASKMESSSASRKVQCSDKSAKLLAVQAPTIQLTKRGKMGIKGKSKVEMVTYFVGDSSKPDEEKEEVKPPTSFAL